MRMKKKHIYQKQAIRHHIAYITVSINELMAPIKSDKSHDELIIGKTTYNERLQAATPTLNTKIQRA